MKSRLCWSKPAGGRSLNWKSSESSLSPPSLNLSSFPRFFFLSLYGIVSVASFSPLCLCFPSFPPTPISSPRSDALSLFFQNLNSKLFVREPVAACLPLLPLVFPAWWIIINSAALANVLTLFRQVFRSCSTSYYLEIQDLNQLLCSRNPIYSVLQQQLIPSTTQ